MVKTKRFFNILITFLTIPVSTGTMMFAQTSPFDSAVFREASGIRERVVCFTDRSLYITGEVIRFRCDIHNTGSRYTGTWSSVLYVELLSPNGERGAYGKFPVHNRISTGEISIPSGILTGNYYLRCYTRWMRNRGPETYGYVSLRIINPYRPELNMQTPPGDTTVPLSGLSVSKEELAIFYTPPVGKRGDTITLDLVPAGIDMNGMAEGCLTVVPSVTRPGVPQHVKGSQTEDMSDFRVNFLPDLMGATLSGKVYQTGNEEQTLQNEGIHITVLGNQPDYLITRSDALGRFSVTLPFREGRMMLLVQPEYSDTGKAKVRIDPDFDQRNLPVLTGSFHMTDEEKQIATIMVRKVQLSAIYREVDSTRQEGSPPVRIPFYGAPTFSLNMDDYVLLPTLEEVFFNLVPGVSPVTRKDKTTLLIRNENPVMAAYAPLYMIDEVPVFNMDRFMSAPTNKISRIDVIEDVYIKGDTRFGGIINLRSKEKDMAGIDLPRNAFFMDIEAMNSSKSVAEASTSPFDHMPDTRNTLCWIPQLKVKKDSLTQISFIAPDYPGTYVVLFRGVDRSGNMISAETPIRIE